MVAFSLTTIQFGRILEPGAELTASTAGLANKLVLGDTSVQSFFTPMWFINMRDSARLHIAALIDHSANGQWIFAFAAPFSGGNAVLDVARKLYPHREFVGVTSDPGEDVSEIPNGFARELLERHLGKGFTGLEETLRENFSMLKLD